MSRCQGAQSPLRSGVQSASRCGAASRCRCVVICFPRLTLARSRDPSLKLFTFRWTLESSKQQKAEHCRSSSSTTDASTGPCRTGDCFRVCFSRDRRKVSFSLHPSKPSLLVFATLSLLLPPSSSYCNLRGSLVVGTIELLTHHSFSVFLQEARGSVLKGGIGESNCITPLQQQWTKKSIFKFI